MPSSNGRWRLTYPDAWIDESKRDANDGRSRRCRLRDQFQTLLLPVRPAARAGRNRDRPSGEIEAEIVRMLGEVTAPASTQ